MGSRGASAGSGAGTLPGVAKANTMKVTAMAAMLRDVADAGKDYDYVNKEHQMMADVADTLYNANIGPENFKPEYKAIYDKYGKAFWSDTIKEMGRIDDVLANDNNAANAFGGTTILGQYKNLTGKK